MSSHGNLAGKSPGEPVPGGRPSENKALSGKERDSTVVGRVPSGGLGQETQMDTRNPKGLPQEGKQVLG
jgi:hypothetical protein